MINNGFFLSRTISRKISFYSQFLSQQFFLVLSRFHYQVMYKSNSPEKENISQEDLKLRGMSLQDFAFSIF